MIAFFATGFSASSPTSLSVNPEAFFFASIGRQQFTAFVDVDELALPLLRHVPRHEMARQADPDHGHSHSPRQVDVQDAK